MFLNFYVRTFSKVMIWNLKSNGKVYGYHKDKLGQPQEYRNWALSYVVT